MATLSTQRFSVRRSLLGAVLACMVPAVMVIAWLVHDAYILKRDALESRTSQIANAAMAYVERELAVIESSLKVLATSSELVNGDLATFQRKAEDALVATPVLNFVLTDAQGRQRVNTLMPFGDPLPETGTPPELKRVFQSRNTVLSSLFKGPVTQQYALAMGVPVLREGAVPYSLNIGMAPMHVNRMLAHVQLPDGWLIAVLDRNGTIIGRSRDADTFVGKPAVETLWRSIQARPQGTLRSTTQEGRPVITAHVTSDQWGWSIAVGAPENELRAALMRSTRWGLLGMLVALSLGVGLALRLGRRVVDSVHELNRQALAVIDGTPVPAVRLMMQEAEDVSLALHRAAGAMGTALFLANHDVLTGLGNRIYLEDQASRLAALARRQGAPLALVMLDLDGFKGVNDVYGHAEGDRVLQEVAQRIRAQVRREDIVARIGGDEFCVMLYNMSLDEAMPSAQRLIAALSEPYPGVSTRVGASAGVTAVNLDEHGLPHWLSQADAALYDAKAQGKGRVVPATHDETPKSE